MFLFVIFGLSSYRDYKLLNEREVGVRRRRYPHRHNGVSKTQRKWYNGVKRDGLVEEIG